MELFESLVGVRKATENIHIVNNSFIQAAHGMAETLLRISEQSKRILEKHEINIKTGWWYPNFILGDLSSEQINSALKNEEKEKTFSRLILKESRKNNQRQLNAMYERWRSYAFLPENRRRVLLDALEAHILRKYTLSIPVTLAQIEYFYHKLFPKKSEKAIRFRGKNIDQIIGEQQINFARQFGLDDPEQIPADYYFQLYPIYYYFENVLFANESLRRLQKSEMSELYKMSDPNNRHAILHGERATYPSEQRSLKQILFLDKILHEMDKLIKENRL